MPPRLHRRTSALARAIAAAALLAAAARAAPAEPVTVRARPARLLLGSDRLATLEIEAGPGPAPALVASAGRVERVRAAGRGRFLADYLPPGEGYPRVAIVVARAGARVGWIAIPLHGTGVAVAHTDPHARIRVTIAERSFGPARADGSGTARVTVVVPPGVTTAYHGDRPLDLHVPPTPHVLLLADRPAVRADRDEEVTLLAFAVAPDGTPRPSAPLELAVAPGEVGPPEEAGGGGSARRWRLPAGAAGEATATVRIADDPAPPCVVSLARVPGPAARLSLSTDPEASPAGGEVALRLAVADAAGNPVDARPALEASLGTLSPPAPDGPGRWRASLVVPERPGGRDRIEIAARAGPLRASAAIAIVLEPARVVVEGPAGKFLADGKGEATLRVEVLDRLGNPVPGVAPSIAGAEPGSATIAPDGAGAYLVRFRPPRASEDRVEVISVRAGPASSEARLALAAPARRLELSPKIGFAASSGGLRSASFAAEGSWWLDALDRRAGVLVEASAFTYTRTDPPPAGAPALQIDCDARYVPVLLSAALRTRPGPRGRAWASAGAGAAFVASEVAAGSQPAVRESGWVAAAHASVAAGWRLGPGLPFAELRVAWFSDPGFATVQGSLLAAFLSVGYRYDAY